MLLEKEKAQLKKHFKQCESRYRSIVMLSDPDDALILVERLIADLFNLYLSTYKKANEIESIKDVSMKLEDIQDKRVSQLFAEAIDLFQKSMVSPKRYGKGQLITFEIKVLCKLLYELKKIIWRRRNKLRTPLDSYKKKVFALAGIALFAGFIAWSGWLVINYHNRIQNIEETRNTLRYLAHIAYKAKKKSGKPLFEITGSPCSECPCRNQRLLKGVLDTDPCAKAWETALARILIAAEENYVPQEKCLRDPWNSPYALDENELECGKHDCRNDTIRSVGEDGILGTSDDIVVYIKNAVCL